MKQIPWQQHVLMIPGPTPVPLETLQAAAQPMMNHRGPEFKLIIEEIEQNLRQVFHTKSPVAVLTSSGSGAMEASIVNVLSPNDKVLACPTGVFGQRFLKIAKAYGTNVEILETPSGQGVHPEAVQNRLKQDTKQEIKAVLITHNETSTAVESDLKALSEARGNHPALLIVDSVSAMGASPLKMDDWKLDVVATASQKALMSPPGLAFVALSERAWEANQQAKMPRFYFDLKEAKEFQAKGQTPFTPSLSVIYAEQISLRLLLAEGVENSWKRHKTMAHAVQSGLEAMGLQLYAHPAYRSNTVTAVTLPPGTEAKKILEAMRLQYGVVIGGGQGDLADKIFRIGHMGFMGEKEVLYTLSCLGKVLGELGFSAKTDAALKVASDIFAGKSPSPAFT